MATPKNIHPNLKTTATSKLVRKFSARSAVAIVISTQGGKPAALFIQRAVREGDPWSGDVAFPGGKQQQSDRNTWQTALRELYEETGIVPTHTHPLYRLRDRLTRLHHAPLPMTISPWLFETEQRQEVTLNHESTESMWLTLADFKRKELQSTLEWKTRIGTFTMPTIEIEGYRIWGITLSIINSMIAHPEIRKRYF